MSVLFSSRRDLDEWADALGVDNDMDATGSLQRLLGRLLDGQDKVRAVTRSLSQAPSGSGDEVRDELAKALGRIDLSVLAIESALRGFRVHERR